MSVSGHFFRRQAVPSDKKEKGRRRTPKTEEEKKTELKKKDTVKEFQGHDADSLDPHKQEEQ